MVRLSKVFNIFYLFNNKISIFVLEYIIEDPSLLEEIKTPSQPIDSTSSTTGSDDEQQSMKNKFAQIKAKFERKNLTNVMASPSTSSVNSSSTASRQNSRNKIDDLYARHRRPSNESTQNNRMNNDNRTSAGSSSQSVETPTAYHRSQSIGSEPSKINSFKRLDSADEADEEVRRIHRQGKFNCLS
jgi:hypothetical protein